MRETAYGAKYEDRMDDKRAGGTDCRMDVIGGEERRSEMMSMVL